MAPARPISVVILDDEVHIRRAVVDYLHDEGRFDAREAASAAEALAILDGTRVDVCLVDLRLKGTDGFVFIQEARPRHPGVQFLIQTGSYEVDVRERARAAGIAEERILLKPFPLEALVLAIDRALGA